MAKISEELQMIDSLLMEFHERIQSGRCLTNKQQNAFIFVPVLITYIYHSFVLLLVIKFITNNNNSFVP